MDKKHIVKLTDQQRVELSNLVKKLAGPPTKIRRAQILLKSDSLGPCWTDKEIAEAYSCSIQTVENVRRRFCSAGYSDTMHKKREHVPRCPKLDGSQEARIIALRLGDPPKGFANWTLRLLQSRVVELAIVDSISPETLRKSLKKMA